MCYRCDTKNCISVADIFSITIIDTKRIINDEICRDSWLRYIGVI